MHEKAKQIIKDFSESRAQIRAIIAEYEDTEFRLYKSMLDQLQSLSESTHTAEIYSELAHALD